CRGAERASAPRVARPPARDAPARAHADGCLARRSPWRGAGPVCVARLAAVSDTAQRQELWGDETRKAVANFPVSGQPIPTPVARWPGRIKAAAPRVNAARGLLGADQ